jgi:hypothetical protein
MEKTTNISIDSSSAEEGLGRLDHCSSTVSIGVLEDGFKRALEKTCNDEPPTSKKQKKESWAFRESAKVVKPPSSIFESSASKTNVSTLAGLAVDIQRAKTAQMVQQATVMAMAIGRLDPELESHPNGRLKFQRRNSFIIHPNLLNGTHNEANDALGLPRPEANLFARRLSLPLSQSPRESSTRSYSSSD